MNRGPLILEDTGKECNQSRDLNDREKRVINDVKLKIAKTKSDWIKTR